jgi:hypothetical protein
MKNAFLIVIIVLNGIYLSAQTLHIVQDINHCAFGLKNDSDKWVVHPVYMQIEEVSENVNPGRGWIVTYDGVHYGLLNDSGKVLYPAIYSSVKFEKKFPQQNIWEPQPEFIVGKDSGLTIPEYPIVTLNDDIYYFSYVTYDYNTTVGFADSLGNVITVKLYHDIGFFQDGHASFRNENGYYGYLDKKGNEIVPPLFYYGQISAPTNYGVYVHNDSMSGFIRWRDGKFIPMKMKYVSYYNLGDSSFVGKQGNKYGILGSNGNIVVSAIYDTIERPVNGFCRVRKNGKVGLMNTAGKFLLKTNCSIIEDFEYDYDPPTGKRFLKSHCILFERKDKTGLFSDEGKIILKPTYSISGWYADNHSLFWGLKGNQVHAFRFENPVLAEIPFQQMFYPNNSDSIIMLTGLTQTIKVDRDGKLIGKPFPWIQLEADPEAILPDGFHAIKGKKGYGIMNSDSSYRIIVPTIFKDAGTFGRFLRSGHGYETFDDGYFYVETYGGHYGVYSPEGKLIVDTIYTTLTMIRTPENCWTAQTSRTGDWHLINENGKVIAVSDKEILPCSGKYIITRNGHEDLFDAIREKYIFENNYQYIFPTGEGMFMVTNDENKVGLMNAEGRFIFPCSYSGMNSPVPGIILLDSDSGEAVADTSGKIISSFSHVPLAFRNISFDSLELPRGYTLADLTDHPDDYTTISLADTSLHYKSCRIANNFLFDTLYSISASSMSDDRFYLFNYAETITVGEENINWENDWNDYGTTYSVESVTPVSFSFTTYSFSSGHGGFWDDYSVSNYIIRNDSISQINLYDILRGDTSYESINDTIRAAIANQAEYDFFFDCSNPEVLSPDYFSITENGISVAYMNRNEEVNEEMRYDEIFNKIQTVELPWSLIGKFLKPGTVVQRLSLMKN